MFCFVGVNPLLSFFDPVISSWVKEEQTTRRNVMLGLLDKSGYPHPRQRSTPGWPANCGYDSIDDLAPPFPLCMTQAIGSHFLQ